MSHKSICAPFYSLDFYLSLGPFSVSIIDFLRLNPFIFLACCGADLRPAVVRTCGAGLLLRWAVTDNWRWLTVAEF
ncbi:hypothetical protein HanRHA438_Chr15g0715291 [Helianthus annuus]|nr:hypothetical protein HanIR_Chr15g0764621 [Helianthus annuus]KAJ0845581.1 hypothetical protein HanRHA438_Chr15g0715291 [Helianthus annuus]